MSIDEQRGAFDQIYTAYYRRSFLFVRSYIHDDMASEDIVAESLIKLWQYLSSHAVENQEVLLLTILKNRALDYLRHERVRQQALEQLSEIRQQELELRISSLQECNPEQVFSEEVMQIIHRTLEQLPERTRMIFQLSRFEKLTNREIAEQMELSLKDVEYHISKSLKLLRVALKDYLPLATFLFLS